MVRFLATKSMYARKLAYGILESIIDNTLFTTYNIFLLSNDLFQYYTVFCLFQSSNRQVVVIRAVGKASVRKTFFK